MSVLLNEEISSYLELLNDRQKEAVLSVVKAFAEEDENESGEYSDEFKKQLDDDYEAYLKGEEPAVSWEDLKKQSMQMLHGDAKP